MSNSTAAQALKSIRSAIAHQEKVIFVFHAWRDMSNIASAGLAHPAIPLMTIPRMELIPIVETQDALHESRINERSPTLSIIPVKIPFTRSIEDTYTDLVNSFGQFGLTRIAALDCSLDDVDRYDAVFNRMMEGFRGGVLQDLPEYFGERSPVADQFGADKTRVTTTAYTELKKLAMTGEITEQDYETFLKALPTLAQSAVTAHRQALLPGQGILPQSILNINSGDKQNFDETDHFLIRQFPGFSADSRISKKTETDGITKLAELLADMLGAPVQRETVREMVAPTAPPEPELDFVENGPAMEPELDPSKCKAITAAGAQCQRDPEANGYCNHFAHAAMARVEDIEKTALPANELGNLFAPAVTKLSE